MARIYLHKSIAQVADNNVEPRQGRPADSELLREGMHNQSTTTTKHYQDVSRIEPK